MTPKQSHARSRRTNGNGWARWLAVGAIAVIMIAGIWVFAVNGDDGAGSGVDGADIAHVHGLGVDPGDGELRVATHNGLFRVGDDGTVEEVSETAHDFMGFTIVGADHYLASGHPALGSAEFEELDQPLFGLIESTDGGRRWKPASLSGQADFHALAAVHDRVYGFDGTSGRLLVSDDGGEGWESRSSIGMADLAVDPADPDRIVASTQEGVVESVDGGRTWTAFDAPPTLIFLDWHDERGMWALDSTGGVHRFDQGTWELRQALEGSPQALLVHDDGVVAAVDDGSTVLHESSDGDEWRVLFRSSS